MHANEPVDTRLKMAALRTLLYDMAIPEGFGSRFGVSDVEVVGWAHELSDCLEEAIASRQDALYGEIIACRPLNDQERSFLLDGFEKIGC